jgi:cysteine desulfurase
MKFPVYLDHNATTPCDPQVLESMLPWFVERFGNASSIHHPFGWVAENAVELAREQLANLIQAKPKEVFFTSGATEAINLGIRGVMEANTDKGNHLITVATEHKAVLDTCKVLEHKGTEVTYLPVNKEGMVDLVELEASIRQDTVMIVVMMANNETGLIQPIQEIGLLAKSHGLYFLSDAVQGAGKIPIDVNKVGIDLMPLSAHKMYGPKGVGALYISGSGQKINIVSQITGGGQERGLRSGTLNVPGIVGFGAAAEIASQQMGMDQIRLKKLRDNLEKSLLEIEGTYLNGHPEKRLPHVSHISFEGVEGKELLLAVNKELAVSSGSACASSLNSAPSHVLTAMGIENQLAASSLRFGLGRSTTESQVEFSVRFVKDTVFGLREKGSWKSKVSNTIFNG